MTDHRSHPNPSLRGWHLGPGIQQPGLYYRFMRRGCHALCTTLWNTRVYNRHLEPPTGGVVYVSNHQSFLDPVLATMALRRPGNYMARDSLFRNPLFCNLIDSLNAFPIRRGAADLAALKEAMRRLKGGRTLVIFPEGTRTKDGTINPFLPGVAILSQRAAEWTVPVVIDGAFDAWPRSQALPRPGRIAVQYGQPVHQSDARKLDAQAFVDNLRHKMIDIQTDIRRRIGRGELRYPDAERMSSHRDRQSI
ncbi:MAG: 1-acyl-sn-glycerol-3-phosphate acyltransferase [Planctomycetes bacterium]|jgi:1-acyl-sn-glycerol-3-phosphate acyltransferase|nr:1-acyl-sn-glycerol-3-phosphate acyltransferase [Phycisphaerae bacterium]NBB94438.1 1-acyl-sn-glycerol-3-phosphate acyltransferase [Planctomycetota bacterium]